MLVRWGRFGAVDARRDERNSSLWWFGSTTFEVLLEAMTDPLLCKLDPHADATAHGTEFTDPPKPIRDPLVPSPPHPGSQRGKGRC